jgi:hypothetical protein
MSRDALDEELRNARREMDLSFAQVEELEPWARQIGQSRFIDESHTETILGKIRAGQSNQQLAERLVKVIRAQANYIRLVEMRMT